jgi:hypothetical protein
MSRFQGRLYVQDTDGTQPFLHSPQFDTAKEVDTWYENERPLNYPPLKLDLWQDGRYLRTLPLQIASQNR